MTYKEKVINDYGIDLTHSACPCEIFKGGYDCFADDNENLLCEDCWGREYNNEEYIAMVLAVKSENNSEKAVK